MKKQEQGNGLNNMEQRAVDSGFDLHQCGTEQSDENKQLSMDILSTLIFVVTIHMPVKIAIVDDKASNRNILKDKLLRHSHFEVTLTAENGKDFLEKMKIAA